MVVVPQLHQQLSLFDPVALLDVEHLDAPAHDRGQLGALAGLDGAGTGVGDAGFDGAAIDFAGDDGDRLGAGKPPERCSECGDDDEGDEQAANQDGHDGSDAATNKAKAGQNGMFGEKNRRGKGSPGRWRDGEVILLQFS
ncbi:hypothetical protein SDC9_201535 [bioreactor metagenome]|uniref:Uncharacterized protein n=1 Tax=bioreactor metagenome TaxID=1076179 RepID=A0A645IRL6_9ZZZZ